MEVNSVKNLCKKLISLAVQRCRFSGDPCRLSIVIRRPSTTSGARVAHISISDTGDGSCLKEFQGLKYTHNMLSAVEWDGMLSVTTTGIRDAEIFHCDVNLKENAPSRRLTKLPLSSKKNAVFSGTEVSMSIMSTTEDVELLLADITTFLKKMLVLKICNIAIKLVGEFGDQQGLRSENVAFANELTVPLPNSSNLDYLASGLEDYVHKHWNHLLEKCKSCFLNRDSLKVGSGQACEKRNTKDTLVAEAVIIISESSDPSSPSCLKAFEPKTEVIFFLMEFFLTCLSEIYRNLSGSLLPRFLTILSQPVSYQSFKNREVDYGLTLKSIEDEETALAEWENFPPNTHIDIVLHCYNNQVVVPPPLKQKSNVETKLMKEAISLALDDLKETYSGVLLSAHAVKINMYAPDLAKSIAGLILSSDDPNFQGECLSLLGMQIANAEGDSVEECIKQKILSAIDISDRKPPDAKRSEDVSFLFGGEHNQEQENMWDEYEGEDEECTLMDF